MTVAAIIQLLGPGVLAVGVWSPEEWPGAGALSMIAHNRNAACADRDQTCAAICRMLEPQPLP